MSGIRYLEPVPYKITRYFRILLFPVLGEPMVEGISAKSSHYSCRKNFFLGMLLQRDTAESIQKSFSGANNAFGRKPRNHKMREQEKEIAQMSHFTRLSSSGLCPFLYCCDTLIRISFSAATLSLTAYGHFIC
jgi:hypothetical protein